MAITRSQSGVRSSKSEKQKPLTRPSSTRKTPSSTSSTTTRESRTKTKLKPSSQTPSSYALLPILPLPPPHPYAVSIPDRQPHHFGLIQERLSLLLPTPTYALLIQAILWNQTTGRTALPVLRTLLSLFPNASVLAAAPVALLAQILYPIGLYNVRAARLIAFAKAWVESPPCPERRYQRRNYPTAGCGRDVKAGVVLEVDDEREGWEVAHLPGVGPYALDSWRIFGRDGMRGVEVEGKEGESETEPEWRRVVPEDKDLRAWMIWRCEKEGWVYDVKTGRRRRKSEGGTEEVVEVEGVLAP